MLVKGATDVSQDEDYHFHREIVFVYVEVYTDGISQIYIVPLLMSPN